MGAIISECRCHPSHDAYEGCFDICHELPRRLFQLLVLEDLARVARGALILPAPRCRAIAGSIHHRAGPGAAGGAAAGGAGHSDAAHCPRGTSSPCEPCRSALADPPDDGVAGPEEGPGRPAPAAVGRAVAPAGLCHLLARAGGLAALWLHDPPLLPLLGAAASHGLLTGQIVFSAAFVGACELPNWIQAPRLPRRLPAQQPPGR